ncbi:hypothetical protein Ndes2526A_g02127 [Nannochloris sp. 'desiccata']
MVSPFTVVLPAIYMSLSLLSLNYFKVLYTLYTKLVYAKISNPLFKAYIQPALSQGLTFTQHSLGPAEKLQFSLNHVIMMTVVLVLMVELGRLRGAIKSRR